MRARCDFQLETINMFNRQLFVLSTARSFTFLPTGEVSTTINQIIKVSIFGERIKNFTPKNFYVKKSFFTAKHFVIQN